MVSFVVALCATLLAVGRCIPQSAQLSKQEGGTPLDAAKDPIFDGNPDDVDKKIAKTVWEAAYTTIVSSSTSVTKLDDRYVKWFGAKNEGHLSTVQQDMKESMESISEVKNVNEISLLIHFMVAAV